MEDRCYSHNIKSNLKDGNGVTTDLLIKTAILDSVIQSEPP